MTLPKSGSSVNKAHRLRWFDFGFGLDHMSNDYKVVKIVCAKDNHHRYVVHRVELLALVLGDPMDCVCILAFDIVEEVFREIALRNHQIDVILRIDVSITVLGKSLAVILCEAVFTSVKMIGTNHVWVKEEYGVIESWTKGCRKIGKQRWLTLLGSRKNDDVLMVQDGLLGPRELVSCDTKSYQIKHLGLYGDSFYVKTYMESLVALDVVDGV
ncbi:F-box/kelch-repeat protein At3g06240-like [Camellia sinensis]|uniref:F-box/kelch-repeat protein At3g06240-like n=1 Tax=Camellia sinensis TaxID=4442 RepID=UPI0010360953|nr:F-box/kelch-repeat protein At3g06240-like [Camellia sinensis]